jgi:hypothetical protein
MAPKIAIVFVRIPSHLDDILCLFRVIVNLIDPVM